MNGIILIIKILLYMYSGANSKQYICIVVQIASSTSWIV